MLGPEQELLILCARPAVGDGEIARRFQGALRGARDGPGLIQDADRHGLVPHLHRWVKASGEGGALPRLGALQESQAVHARRGLLTADELVRSLRLLSTRGISVIPYRGPALALLLYGDAAQRQFVDASLLVHPEDLPQVHEVLGAQGYLSERKSLSGQSHESLSNESLGLCLELHWALAPRPFSYRMDLEGIWQRAVPMMLAGESVRTLSPEDLLLTLCVHGGRHRWERLGWVADVAALLARQTSLEWGDLETRVQAAGCEWMLWLGILLAHDVLGAPVPEAALQGVCRDPAVSRLAREVAVGWFP